MILATKHTCIFEFQQEDYQHSVLTFRHYLILESSNIFIFMDDLKERLIEIRDKCAEVYEEKIHETLNRILLHENRTKIVKIEGTGYYRLDLNEFAKGISQMFGYQSRSRSFLAGSSSSCFLTGKAHGSAVHSAVDVCVDIINGYTDIEFLIYKSIYIDPCVHRLFAILLLHKVYPVHTELLVYDPLSFAATSIDMIGYDASIDKFVAIEIKTVSSRDVESRSHTNLILRDMRTSHMRLKKMTIFSNYSNI